MFDLAINYIYIAHKGLGIIYNADDQLPTVAWLIPEGYNNLQLTH